ncbi:HNH endonuclease signature motif containing protein [Tomitella gaofuii]|uniref:HNH endonuclease signature motif containing protein n=1 Tax=Tomitella gaofuii TaxID=2760083 RepID=UPI0015F96509|nr:HNH endonuclease signature motif containing protein [Tomitella gaofuii]
MTASLWCRTDPELVEGLDDAVHSLFAREVDLLRLIAELSGRGSDVGNPAQVASMVADRTTMSLYLARNLVTFAQRLRDRPRVFESYAGERISKPSATLIMDFLDDPPPNMPADEVATAESVLIEFASSHKQAELSATIDGIREHYTELPCDSEPGSAGDGASEGDDHGAGSSGKDGTEGDSGAEGEGRAAGGQDTPWPLRRRSDTFGGDDTTRNTLFLSRTLGGRYVVRGDLDAETGERLSAVLSPYSAPRPEADGTRDRRSAPKRRADGLAEFLRRHTTCSAADGQGSPGGESARGSAGTAAGGADHAGGTHDLGGGAGTGATLSVHIGLRDLADTDADHAVRAGLIAAGRYAEVFDNLPHGLTDWFAAMPVSAARRLACDAAVTPVGVDGHGAPLNVGRTRRLATAAQRRALAARDHGCAFPRCDRPPAWCIAHHVHHWVDGGPTDLDNLVSLCTEHHRSVHHHGWKVTVDAAARRPRFRAPAGHTLALQWLDSDGGAQPPPE